MRMLRLLADGATCYDPHALECCAPIDGTLCNLQNETCCKSEGYVVQTAR
jgi:hypothetical protein